MSGDASGQRYILQLRSWCWRRRRHRPPAPLDPAAAPVVTRVAISRAPPFSSRLPAAVPVTVVTAAAPNGNRLASPSPLAMPLHGAQYRMSRISDGACDTRSMRRMQRAAQRLRCVLPWGGGVFGNRPQVVADLWSDVFDALEWRGHFECVVFAPFRMVCTVTRLPPSAARSTRSPLDPREPRVCVSLRTHTVGGRVRSAASRFGAPYVMSRTWAAASPPPRSCTRSWFGLYLRCTYVAVCVYTEWA